MRPTNKVESLQEFSELRPIFLRVMFLGRPSKFETDIEASGKHGVLKKKFDLFKRLY